MEVYVEKFEERFMEALAGMRSAGDLTLEEKRNLLLSQVEALIQTDEGFRFVAGQIGPLVEAGLFKNTVWENAERLVAGLVPGTLRAGYPSSVMEILSELRLVYLATDENNPTQEHAQDFLKQVVAQNLDLLFPGETEEDRFALSAKDRQKLERLFSYILESIPIDAIKERLAEEMMILTAQRRIMVDHLIHVVKLVKDKITMEPGKPADDTMIYYMEALYHPTPMSKEADSVEEYLQLLKNASPEIIEIESAEFGDHMERTGLVSDFHIPMIHFLKSNYPQYLDKCLSLNGHGRAELKKYRDFAFDLIDLAIIPEFPQGVVGLSYILQRTLLSRAPIRNALRRLMNIQLNKEIESLLQRNRKLNSDPLQLLLSGTISILGLPLGIGQGMNPTCQSARGISMWSQHAPAKLLQRIITVASYNNLEMNYDSKPLQSAQLTLQTGNSPFDFNLDPVSIVLVPHLDRIYNEMSRLALFHYPMDDPHKSVNPAFYGSWIQTGFMSVYNQLLNAIDNYSEFIRSYYSSYHPDYNGGNQIVYPVPLGIYITTAQGEFLGFHAISLLRVARLESGEVRAYFLNPNNEGRQDWGQGIKPTVYVNQEKAGESSLPFDQLAARVYAFHFNTLMVKEKLENVPHSIVANIEKTARESWGKKYNWI